RSARTGDSLAGFRYSSYWGLPQLPRQLLGLRSGQAHVTRGGLGHCYNMPERKGPRQLDESSLKAEQYRNRAAELAAIAEETKDPTSKQTMEKLSRDYLKMASQMDQIAAINRQLHIEPKS